MAAKKRALQVVWCKRDLRVVDHAPLHMALAAGEPVMGVYVIEPKVVRAEDYAPRHWACVSEALADLTEALTHLNVPMLVVTGEVLVVLDRIRNLALAQNMSLRLWTHQETGNDLTYQRDRAVLAWTKQHGVDWHERLQHGVFRRLENRDGWAQRWEELMHLPQLPTPRAQSDGNERILRSLIERNFSSEIPSADELGICGEDCQQRQSARRGDGLEMLRTFLAHRGANYQTEMSSPVTATESCSRLSVPLAYGTVSMREIVQATEARAEELRELWKAKHPTDFKLVSLRSFLARLHWHCHFIQKLESEPAVEFRAFIPELDKLRNSPETGLAAEEKASRLEAWQEGRTGYPFIDACMRSLKATGWINFRMRAMLMSFASYDLWLPWRDSGMVLARRFTDYEPGIHWPQVQMQSGTTGINTLRMYSPVKQSRDQDPKGVFIKRWVPELAAVPADFIHEPWTMSVSDQVDFCARQGRDYPRPIVDHTEAVREARSHFASLRREHNLRAKAKAVFARHGSRKRPGTQIVDPRWFDKSERPVDQLELEGLQ